MKKLNIEKEGLYDYDRIEGRRLLNKERLSINLLKSTFIMTLTILVSFIFYNMNLNEATIILIYILGVLFISITTEGYFFGIVASIISVLSFNFLFTEPYYTLLAYRADYPITFFIMLIVAIITSTLMSNVKEEAMIANLREKRIEALYRSNRKLLQAENKKQVTDFSGESLVEILNKDVMICLAKDNILEEENIYYKKNTETKDMFISYIDKEAMKYSFNQRIPCGLGTNYYKNIKNYYYPIKGQNKIIGIIGINLNDENNLTNTENILLESISVQIALAIERENLFEKNRKVSLEAERERLRGNLLRSISHDLRTPLTSILGSVSTIIDNDEVLDSEIKKELLKNVYDDTVWLSQSFENILSMTRIDEGRLELNKKVEIVDEIVVEAISRVKKFSKSHNINLSLPDDIILINADGLLIEQVLVNLIQNAVRYTPKNSNINIKIIRNSNYIIFEIEDNGCGISKENIENIFERFYTKTKAKQGEQRGIGLGLAICKSIIEAHDGDICVFNNNLGGATFRFSLPARGEI